MGGRGGEAAWRLPLLGLAALSVSPPPTRGPSHDLIAPPQRPLQGRRAQACHGGRGALEAPVGELHHQRGALTAHLLCKSLVQGRSFREALKFHLADLQSKLLSEPLGIEKQTLKPSVVHENVCETHAFECLGAARHDLRLSPEGRRSFEVLPASKMSFSDTISMAFGMDFDQFSINFDGFSMDFRQ